MVARKTFRDSVTPLPPQHAPKGLVVQAASAAHRAETLTVLFALAIPKKDQQALEEKVARGETVTPAELSRFAPSTADVERVRKWLDAEGFKGIEVSADRTGIYAQASGAQLEKSLRVNMVRVTKNGRTYTAARNAPSLPADVGAPVRAIIGLQPFRHVRKHRAIRAIDNLNRIGMGPTQGLSAGTNVANAPPYLVKEILEAYDAGAVGVTGKGQTIGILIDTFPRASDVQAFWTKNGLPVVASRVVEINVTGAHLPPVEGEETLDVEWTSGIAADATVRVYASGSLSFVALDKALDRILADAAADKTLRQVSISLGLGETYFGGANGEVAVQHQKFLELAALGVNVFVSSGDAGSNPDQTGHSSTGPLQVEYEASDPCVVAVGGTSLRLDASGKVASETAWTGAGGGKSKYFPRPTWQKGARVPAGKNRLVPDVAAPADPDTGAFVYLQGSVQAIGGTSWSAPVWAGICALINEARAKAGKPSVPFLNPLLYPLQAKVFRDITSGSNGAYKAGPGYDMVTGLGTPDVAKLIAALCK